MPDSSKYELIIIGGGAAAFAAAFKAEAYGVKTAMIERGLLGGTCINVGCVPSKNLLGAGELIHSSKEPTYSSIMSCEIDFDFSQTIVNKDKLVKNLRKQKYYDVISPLENVELIEANASFVSDKKLKINNRNDSGEIKIIEADKFIIAAGSSPSIPPFKGIEEVDYLTSNEALSLKEKPASMIIIGGRALGLEFAQMYSRFGTKIIILQRGGRIIPDHEPEISYGLHRCLAEEGIEIVTDVKIKEVYQKNGIKFVNTLVSDDPNIGKTDKMFEAEQVLMATGRKPNTADLHLENAGVKTRDTDGAILVDSQMHTSVPHIWAGGDVVGGPMLETLAAKEGATAAVNALTGSHKRIDFLSMPSAIFTSPQVASVGFTEEQMTEKYGYCSCRTLNMDQVPKAGTVNETKGLIKMVVDPKKNKIRFLVFIFWPILRRI